MTPQGDRMKSFVRIFVFTAFVTGAVRPLLAADQPASSYEAEKAKALANPFANDFGPTTVDVTSYPPELQETYKKYLQTPGFACQRCHTASPPLNSQFVEPSG